MAPIFALRHTACTHRVCTDCDPRASSRAQLGQIRIASTATTMEFEWSVVHILGPNCLLLRGLLLEVGLIQSIAYEDVLLGVLAAYKKDQTNHTVGAI